MYEEIRPLEITQAHVFLQNMQGFQPVFRAHQRAGCPKLLETSLQDLDTARVVAAMPLDIDVPGRIRALTERRRILLA